MTAMERMRFLLLRCLGAALGMCGFSGIRFVARNGEIVNLFHPRTLGGYGLVNDLVYQRRVFRKKLFPGAILDFHGVGFLLVFIYSRKPGNWIFVAAFIENGFRRLLQIFHDNRRIT